MHYTRWAKLAGFLVAFALVIPVLMTGSFAAAQDGGKVLRIQNEVFMENGDPQKMSFSNEIGFAATNYEGLTRLDQDLNASPAAAESWTFNEDGTELTFTLREGLTYSDGSPLTADRFVFAAQRTCDPNTAGEYQSILYDITGCQEYAEMLSDEAGNPVERTDEELQTARDAVGVTAPDDRTVVMTFNAPAPYFVYVAGLWVFYPAQQELIEAGGDTWWLDAANQLGNGPFQVVEIVQDQLIRFEANENYWGGRPLLDGLELVTVTEFATALEGYRSDDPETGLHILTVDPSSIPELREDPEFTQYPQTSTFNLAFNLTMEPFTDVKVRQAFAYAFDRETYCRDVRNGDCLPTTSWIPEGIPGALDTDEFAFNPELAVQTLAESTYGGPEGLPEIKYYYNNDDPATAQPRAEWIAGQYRDVLGVELTLTPTEGQTLVALRKDPSTFPQMFTGGWIGDYPDPQNWLTVYWTCDATFAKRFAYCDPEFDELVRQGDTTVDQAARIEFYEQAGEILVRDQPGPFLYNLANTFMVKESVQGLSTVPADSEYPGQWTSLLTFDLTE